jgi:hypothetical protein
MQHTAMVATRYGAIPGADDCCEQRWIEHHPTLRDDGRS